MKKLNDNCLEGMRCPACKSQGPFYIVVKLEVAMHDNGTEDGPNGDTEWDDKSDCRCDCGYSGLVSDFKGGAVAFVKTCRCGRELTVLVRRDRKYPGGYSLEFLHDRGAFTASECLNFVRCYGCGAANDWDSEHKKWKATLR